MTSFRFVPRSLAQSILQSWFQGGHFGLFNIELGSTYYPQIEQAVLDRVGTYGSQIGNVADVVAILLRHVDRTAFTGEEAATVQHFLDQHALVNEVKAEAKKAIQHEPTARGP